MADERFVKINGHWYHAPVFKVGDVVVRKTERRQWGNGPRKGETGIVTSVLDSQNYTHEKIDGTYEYVYFQTIKLDKTQTTYKNTSFEYVNAPKENVMQLEVNRPTLVQEFEETVVDGKAVRKNIGAPVSFDSASSARVWCTAQITSSIRTDNVYRRFSILTETAVAQAKEPEIEFK